MHLSYEQGDLFFDVMDALLLYVNDTFHIVEDFSFDDDDPLLETKTSIIATFLWDNVSVIDDFVSNTASLDDRSRSLALSWKQPMQDTFTLVRYQDGCAIMMNDFGAYRVCGITDDFDDTAGRVPALVRAVLLPFEDMIVYDGFLSLSDVPYTQERDVQDRFEHTCATKGIAVYGDDFIERARLFNQKKNIDEEEAFFDSLSFDEEGSDEEIVPEGFHRGALAGLSELKRAQALEAHMYSFSNDGNEAVAVLSARAWNHAPVSAFSDCLALYPAQKLYEACESLGINGYRGKSIEWAVSKIQESLLSHTEDLEDTLLWCEEEQYQSTLRLLAEGDIIFSEADATQYFDLWPLLPYTYLFHGNATFTLHMPAEIRHLLQQMDVSSFAKRRKTYLHVVSCAVACVVYTGIVSVEDAYRQYVMLDFDHVSLEDFTQIISTEASYGDLSFEVGEFEGRNFLVHYTMCDDYVAQQMVQQHAGTAVSQAVALGHVDGNAYQSALGDLRRGIGKEMDNAQNIRTSLIEAHQRMAMKPIDPVMLERDAYEVLCESASVRALRGFLDERIPDGEDDYTFAARAAQGIVSTAIEVGDRQSLLSYVDEIGLGDCCEDKQRFERLLMRVFDDMPSWENNGWTTREVTERLTGRHIFYDDDGRVMHVGVNDPCPCGSGKKYGDCHGRRS